MKSLVQQAVATIAWAVALYLAWSAGTWNRKRATPNMRPELHDSTFHMHQPLHDGGKVTMQGQFHLELISEPDGTHRVWLSNAFRQEMDPAGFAGELTIERVDGEVQRARLEQVGRTRELLAKTAPLQGQAWITIRGNLGEVVNFDGVKLFWDYERESLGLRGRLGLDPMIPRSLHNPLTSAKVELGRELFFDRRLSADGTISCASCHQPEHAFAEGKPTTIGIAGRRGRRNTPTVLNAVYVRRFFWDGRGESLDEQARGPILSPDEMGNEDETSVVTRLQPIYGVRMREAFGEPTSLDTISKAVACFERTLLSGDSDFDRYEAGSRDAISPAAQRGRTLFFGKGGCVNCHIPPLFADDGFHNLGVGWTEEEPAGDLGRYEVTNDWQDRGAFKTPTLRDVNRTAPYMHDGSLATLKEVVSFYNQGGKSNPTLDPLIKPLRLEPSEIDDLVEFLKTLDGRFVTPSRSHDPDQMESAH